MATTIAVSDDTKEVLRQIGEKGESYDRIIQRFLKPTSSYPWTNYNVYGDRIPNFPETVQ